MEGAQHDMRSSPRCSTTISHLVFFFVMRVGRYFNACRFSTLALVAVMASATLVAVIVFPHQYGHHIVIFAMESILDQLLDYDRVWGSHADRRRKLQSDN